MILLRIYLVLHLLLSTSAQNTSSPNIVFIYADDLGWNDVSFHGSPQIPTPNIDALAMSGILLNNYYGQWICTPSRASLLSGKDVIRLGLQHFVLKAGEKSGLPLDIVTLPQYLKKLNYATHMVGKWHLGYQSKEYTPTYRGFDSFFGYYNGFIDHYDYTIDLETDLKNNERFFGVDLHNNADTQTTNIKNLRGKYAPDLFTEKAVDLIQQHDTSKPLFLYVAQNAAHAANLFQPFQSPPKYVKQVEYIKDVHRRIHAGHVLSLDECVRKVFQALYDKNMLYNTILAFVSDNGAETALELGGAGSNFPFRGKKYTLWEGGNRLPALLWSPLFKLRKPRIAKQMMHVTDWLPTLYRAAGGDPNEMKDIDGMNLWDSLIKNTPSPRKEFLYNIDPIVGTSAVRVKDMKLINGSNGFDSWYNPTKDKCTNRQFVSDSEVRNLLTKEGLWIVKNIDKWRKAAEISCSEPPPIEDGGNCDPTVSPCLFNITKDPCEHHNLADEYSAMVDELMQKIDAYQERAVPPQAKPSDPSANPECHDFYHLTWLDPENYNECTEYS